MLLLIIGSLTLKFPSKRLAQAPSSTAAVGYRQWLDSASERVVAFDLKQRVLMQLQSDTKPVALTSNRSASRV